MDGGEIVWYSASINNNSNIVVNYDSLIKI